MVKCDNCGASDGFVYNYREGDQVCKRCGKVVDERMISEEAEYRLFNDDSSSQSKIRAGPATSTFMLTDLSTSHSRLETEERKFLYDGWRNIDAAINTMFPDSQPAAVRSRAKELYQKAFLFQHEQKTGGKDFKTNEDDQNQLRQRFSKRKAYVVTSLWVALKENRVRLPKTLVQLNRALEGAVVSPDSIKNCLSELGFNPGYLDQEMKDG
mmetsp:Transcript_20174/g.27826  ORF Transcript_20174/g.27826 Transcript_20174/m.27826 type:complete len:211 (-) Transcript_20174:130-762(-)|eukprot:CAMPEP_0201489850 /NCGR_PEP_ID=MMETSP0151_2-20130828/23951_1 /ASSEMBLY_ACC=CAM_ASM_000257 /TAXON_ID=200890 /ORGANISM="Paramoeba atlantica, Strain 621/1 / CCAP 1560/9" /LENGTH=210 /DNA_ID=CAMNT_0047875569 /DNA_START=43 /DNA_END=675 /DNA_ORIENTATION=-